jgi:hypothetical protein
MSGIVLKHTETPNQMAGSNIKGKLIAVVGDEVNYSY